MLFYFSVCWRFLIFVSKVSGTAGKFLFFSKLEDARLDYYMREIAGCQGQKMQINCSCLSTALPEPVTAGEFSVLLYVRQRFL